jgi:hypothetical protein
LKRATRRKTESNAQAPLIARRAASWPWRKLSHESNRAIVEAWIRQRLLRKDRMFRPGPASFIDRDTLFDGVVWLA